jgi:tetratricopeptide (TPR) repeat protein
MFADPVFRMSSPHPVVDSIPDNAHALATALELREKADWPALERFCRNALKRFPGDIQLASQLSHRHWLHHDCASADALMSACLLHHPEDPVALKAVAFYLAEQARYDAAEAMYRSALAIDPDDIDIVIDLAALELRRGDWRAGWTRFERRFERARDGRDSGPVSQAQARAPRWSGEPLAEKRVVVYSELGFGDDL